MKLKKGSKAARDFMASIRPYSGKTIGRAKKRSRAAAAEMRARNKFEKNPSPHARAKKLARRQADYQKRLYGSSPAEYRRSLASRLKRNPAKKVSGKRAGYTLRIGNRDMFVSGISEDEVKALAKLTAQKTGKRVTVNEGKG